MKKLSFQSSWSHTLLWSASVLSFVLLGVNILKGLIFLSLSFLDLSLKKIRTLEALGGEGWLPPSTSAMNEIWSTFFSLVIPILFTSYLFWYAAQKGEDKKYLWLSVLALVVAATLFKGFYYSTLIGILAAIGSVLSIHKQWQQK